MYRIYLISNNGLSKVENQDALNVCPNRNLMIKMIQQSQS